MNKTLLNNMNWQDYYTISDDEIQEMIFRDLDNTNPELCIYKEYIHNAFPQRDAYSHIDDQCNSIVRYYEDEYFARAYAVESYGEGIGIFYCKRNKLYKIVMIGEDDGNRFIVNELTSDKATLLTNLSQAFSIFNANFSINK